MKQVVLFKGSDCVPCTQFEPVFDDLVEYCNTLETQFEFAKHVDNVTLMRVLGLRTVPAVVVFSGEEHKIFTGKDLKIKTLMGYLTQER